MRQKRDPVPRARDAWWWLGGTFTLGILGAGVVAAGVALWENVDVRQLAPGLSEPPSPLPAPMVPSGPARPHSVFPAVVFRSEASAEYFENPDFHEAEVERWKELLESTGGTVREVGTAGALMDVAPDELLVVPEAPCLSPSELAGMGAHLASGGSIVANWALGVRDEECEWRGWSTLLEVTGAEDVREIPRGDGLYLTVPSSLPTSPGLDAGARIELRPDPALALRMSGQRVYWSDWALNPVSVDVAAGADAAVSTTRTDEGGRVAWFAMRTSQAATEADAVRLERLLQSGIAWAAGIPSASPTTWPGASRAAAMFVLDVEGSEPAVQARDAAAVFEAEGLPVTFFVVSGLVEGDVELAESLVRAGEVGTQTLDHAPLTGRTRQEQSMRLGRSRDHLAEWSGLEVRGLHPPEDSYDVYTLEAWVRAGGSYLLAGNDARSASPEVHGTEGGPVVVLPRLLKDDYSVVVRDVTLRSRRLADAFLAGATKMRAIGGLAVVAGHTQIIVTGPRLDAFRTVAESLRGQGDWWMAEGHEIAEWWLARSLVDVRWTEPTELREAPSGMVPVEMYDLVVVAGEEIGVGELWVDVVLPEMPTGAVPLVDGVYVDHSIEPWGMRVSIGRLAPGAHAVVRFAVPAPDEGP